MEDVPRIIQALQERDLAAEKTKIAVDDGTLAFPWLRKTK